MLSGSVSVKAARKHVNEIDPKYDDLRVNCEKEFSLMRSHSRRADAFDQLRVLVDQPRLAQHVRRSVLQLKREEREHRLMLR